MDSRVKLSQLEVTLETKEVTFCKQHPNQFLYGTLLLVTSPTPTSDFHLRFAEGHRVLPQFWKGL